MGHGNIFVRHNCGAKIWIRFEHGFSPFENSDCEKESISDSLPVCPKCNGKLTESSVTSIPFDAVKNDIEPYYHFNI